MIEAGKTNSLKIIRIKDDILTVDAEQFGEIDVINNDLVLKYTLDQNVDVFLLPETDGSVKGFLGNAFANAGEFAKLKVVANSDIGTFFDIGLEKDLFCPFKEQKSELEINHYYLVYVYIDEETNRITASTKFEKFISNEQPPYSEDDNVNILIINKSQLGYNAIVENKYQGLLYENEVFSELKPGQKLNAIIKKVRDDNKIDLRVFRNDHNDISEFETMIIEYMTAHDGKMHLNDESAPEDIYETFGISKKNFKKALGGLYRKSIIDLKDTSVKLLK